MTTEQGFVCFKHFFSKLKCLMENKVPLRLSVNNFESQHDCFELLFKMVAQHLTHRMRLSDSNGNYIV